MRQRDLKRFLRALEKAEEDNQKLINKYTNKIKKDLEEVGKSVIDDWYSDYIPNVYNRLGSLYKAYKVTAKNGKFNVSFSSTYMKKFKHMSSRKGLLNNEYIYQISFIEGWHGGADKGPNHPFEGIPYYREPYPYYTNWYYAAERSFSPYEKMYDEMNNKIKEIDKEYQDEFNNKILNKLNHHINILKGGTK